MHCHTPIAGAISRWVCRKQHKKGLLKVIYTTHGFTFHKMASKKTWLLYYPIESLMSRYSDAIITINNEDFENAKKMHCKQVFKINGVGVNLSKFLNVQIDRDAYRAQLGVKPGEIMVLCIGELSHNKNHIKIIEALGMLKIPNAVFVHCGAKLEENNTENLLIDAAKRLNIKTIFLGRRSDIPKICKCADIGALPSKKEGLCISGVEMLASGLPLIAGNVKGLNDYVTDEVNGYLAHPNSSSEFASGISKLLDANLRENMKKACNKSVLKFDAKVAFKQMEDVYNILRMV
jgi:glycosyltransferase involved in cell wall biosynthesis